MAEAVVAAPVSTVGQANTGNGAQPGAAQAADPQEAKSAAPRAQDGKFLPKQGEAPKPNGAAPKDAPAPYRFKRDITVHGKTEALDLDEDGLTRELQRGRAAQKRQRDAQVALEKSARLIELARGDPDAFLREVGQTPEEWAQKKLAEQARLEAMDANERRAWDLEQENTRLKGDLEQRQKTQEQAEHAERMAAHKKQIDATFIPALDKVGLPKTYETLFLMAETAKIGLDDGVEYTPEQLAKETERRIRIVGDHYFSRATPEYLLKALPPKLLDGLVRAYAKQWQEKQTPGRRAAPVEDVPPPSDKPKYLTEREVNENLKRMRDGRQQAGIK